MDIHEPTLLDFNNPDGSTKTPKPWRLVSDTDINNQATVDITDLNPQRKYLISIYRLVPATDDVILQMSVSNDNGSSFLADSNYYYWIRGNNETTAFINTVTGTTIFDITDDTSGNLLGTVSGEVFHAWIRIENMAKDSNNSFNMNWNTAHYVSGDDMLGSWGLGTYDGAQFINALRFQASSGNLQSGSIRVFEVIR